MAFEKENYEIVKKQEETLRFEHFDCRDAWTLGTTIASYARNNHLSIAVDIWVNGYQVFRYGFQGTNNFNDLWLRRKVNTVNMLHRSTLRVHLMPWVGEDDICTDGHLDLKQYSNMGGGFPIYVNGVGVIGAVAVSGLSHMEDHQMAVAGIAQMLEIKDLEKVKEE